MKKKLLIIRLVLITLFILLLFVLVWNLLKGPQQISIAPLPPVDSEVDVAEEVIIDGLIDEEAGVIITATSKPSDFVPSLKDPRFFDQSVSWPEELDLLEFEDDEGEPDLDDPVLFDLSLPREERINYVKLDPDVLPDTEDELLFVSSASDE